MWRRGKTKSVKRLNALGLLQDAMGRVEHERAEAEDQQLLQQQVPSQQGPPRETSASGSGGAGW